MYQNSDMPNYMGAHRKYYKPQLYLVYHNAQFLKHSFAMSSVDSRALIPCQAQS